MGKKLAAIGLAIAVLVATAVPAFAGGKQTTSCYAVKDKTTGLTTWVCPDGNWD